MFQMRPRILQSLDAPFSVTGGRGSPASADSRFMAQGGISRFSFGDSPSSTALRHAAPLGSPGIPALGTNSPTLRIHRARIGLARCRCGI